MSRTIYLNTDGNELDAEEEMRGYERNEKPARPTGPASRPIAIDHPAYYKQGGIEAIDVIEAWNLGFCLGNTVKYIARAGRKTSDDLQDLKKAMWYLNREIRKRESDEESGNDRQAD